jgi:dTMP kinase
MFLYMASRAQLVEECIRPALQAGKVVVTDRFVLANIVYQGYAGGLDVDQVKRTGEICTAGIEPDCVFVFDIAPQDARRRFTRELDRMELQGEEFQQRLRDGFLREAANSSGKAHVIDAARSIDVIQQEIRAVARRVLAQGGHAGSQHTPA